MRYLRLLYIAPVLLLQGCFFFFIPPGVVSAMSDSLTGAEGEHCVSQAAKVGDFIFLPNGSTWKVETLSGTSVRCNKPELPVRAKLSLIKPI